MSSAEMSEIVHCNQVVVVGELVTEPVWKSLPSGSEIFSFSLTVRAPNEAVTSVPCVWFDPPNRVRRWTCGTVLVVHGRIRRRFYRAGGATGSRTEVEVEAADRLASRSASKRMLDNARSALGELAGRLDAVRGGSSRRLDHRPPVTFTSAPVMSLDSLPAR